MMQLMGFTEKNTCTHVRDLRLPTNLQVFTVSFSPQFYRNSPGSTITSKAGPVGCRNHPNLMPSGSWWLNQPI